MKTLGKILGLFSFIALFLFGLVYFVSTENSEDNSDSAENASVIAKSKSTTSADNRILEKSEIIKQVKSVEKEPSVLLNDPNIKLSWGLLKSDATRAWSVSNGSKDVIVAVIDTGIDINHEDLKNNLWKNPNPNKKKDADGIVDDIHGWNFVSNNNDLTDNHGHGTHIAGIIGAEGGNGIGISGISPHVSLMILKYYDPKVPNTDNLKNTVRAIDYAIAHGAHIINYSGGGTEASNDERDAIARAEKKGILFVAAAGNERSNSDQHHYYPADYKLKNIISVTAIDPATHVLPSSNFGVDTVDIAAPGSNILSTLPGNTYGNMTGTSQATAFVSGAAALIKAHGLANSYEEMKRIILATGDANMYLADKTKSWRILNLFKALTVLDQDRSASGVVTNNNGNIHITNEKMENSNSTGSDYNKLSKNLIEVLQQQKKGEKNRLGAKPSTNEL